MVNTGSPPKSMMARFRPSNRGAVIPLNRKPRRKFLTKGFYISRDLPQLPKPSSELKRVLIQFNNENLKQCTKRKRRLVSKKRGKMNAFMAFRAFYSRCIFSSERQRQLSILLSKFWAKDTDQEVWRRYAHEYNNDNTLEDFIEWLCKALNIKLNDDESPEQIISINPYNPVDVEDVFFVNPK